MIVVSSLAVYPLKGGRGIAVEALELEPPGPRFDRRWMMVDPFGTFLTQREAPRLSLVTAQPHDGGLRLGAPGTAGLDVAPTEPERSRRMVRIWDDWVGAQDCGDEAARWASDWLQRPARLVHLPDSARRPVDRDFDPYGTLVTLADGFPLLLIGEASLAELNRRLERPLPMNRFRPNIVVRGSAAFAEDDWRRFRVGELRFHAVKPCARCAVTTVDQATAERGKEPLTTLATFRKRESGVMFGMNVVHRDLGTIRIGDPLTLE